jgi:hypothetical protein
MGWHGTGKVVQGSAELSYPALTAFCRKHGIGQEPRQPAGHYDFAPGEEMQHDTSPHVAMIGDRKTPVQTASLVLCHSTMLFFQMYPRFTRFECKLFLNEALGYFGGACGRCRIDNTHVVVLSGTGRNMVPVPEMAAFAERFGFEFRLTRSVTPIARRGSSGPSTTSRTTFWRAGALPTGPR